MPWPRGHLLAAYPVLAQCLSLDRFNALARAYWHAQPPQLGDVAQWGGELPSFLRASTQLQDAPYLGDLAALEWAWHRAASAADAQVDAASFALLQTQALTELRLRLAPGCCVVCSHWPIVSIWAAHVDHSVSIDQVRQRLAVSVGEVALIWRAGLRVQVRPIASAEHTLLMQLLAAESLGRALDVVDQLPEDHLNSPAWDINAWLAQAVQSGLLLGLSCIETATGSNASLTGDC